MQILRQAKKTAGMVEANSAAPRARFRRVQCKLMAVKNFD
jgi:hypothetical protein